MTQFVVRQMNRSECDVAVEWAAGEGWNPGWHDAEAFFATDPNGFFVGLLDGQPISSISAVAYGADFGFIGFYIVRPEYRGQGYGWQTWQAAMAYLGNRNVGLDGVLAQQSNYEKSGFRLAYRNARYQGVLPGRVSPVVVADFSFEAVAAYDRQFFPAGRSEFLQHWLYPPAGQTLVVMAPAGDVLGYGVIRACRVGYKIGPLFANSPTIAETLLLALAAYAPAGPHFLDIPAPNPHALELVNRYGLSQVFETARMYTQSQPTLPLANLYGVTTFELG